MTVDEEGHVWSARWGGGVLVRHAPNGAAVQRITFPAKAVSSVTFGGENLDEMYVTTAGGQNKAQNGPGAGALYRLRLGTRGAPEYFSRVGL
jgi:D-xylonolactonase